jgi:hypothetical protein
MNVVVVSDSDLSNSSTSAMLHHLRTLSSSLNFNSSNYTQKKTLYTENRGLLMVSCQVRLDVEAHAD